jgi:hypothetical protein
MHPNAFGLRAGQSRLALLLPDAGCPPPSGTESDDNVSEFDCVTRLVDVLLIPLARRDRL